MSGGNGGTGSDVPFSNSERWRWYTKVRQRQFFFPTATRVFDALRGIPGWVLFYVLLTTLFIAFLRFLDIANMRTFLYASSYAFIGQRTPFFLAPPGFFTFLNPVFVIYLLAGGSLESVAFVLKLLAMGASICSAFLVRKILMDMGLSKHESRVGFMVILFSPMIFILNYVIVEQDIFGILVTLLAILVARPYSQDKQPRLGRRLGGSVLLWYGIALYYYPAALLTSIVFFRRSRSDMLSEIAVQGTGFVCVMAPFMVSGYWDPVTNFLGAGNSGVGTVPVYSIINLFGPGFSWVWLPVQSQIGAVFGGAFVVSMLLVPVAWRILRWSFFSAVATIFTLLFVLVTLYNGDEFVWLFPFLVLFICSQLGQVSSWRWSWFSQVYFIPIFLLWNFWDAPGAGQGTGVFYTLYLQFHWAIAIYTLVPRYAVVSKVLDVVEFAILCIVLLGVVSASYRANLPRREKMFNYAFFTSAVTLGAKHRQESISPLRHFRWHYRQEYLGAVRLITSLVAVGILCGLAYPSYYSPTIVYTGGAAPVGLFTSNPIMNQSYTYDLVNGSGGIEFPSTGMEPVVFSRNLSGERFDMYLSASASPPGSSVVYNDSFFQAGSLNLCLYNRVALNMHSTPLGVSSSGNVTQGNGSIPIASLHKDWDVFYYSGKSYVSYQFDRAEYANRTFGLLFKLNSTQFTQNLVYSITIGNESFQLVTYGLSGYFNFQPAPLESWIHYPVYGSWLSWNLATFNITMDSVSFELDGLPVFSTQSAGLPNESVAVYVGHYGAYPWANDKYAMDGVSSSLLVNVTPLGEPEPFVYVENGSLSGAPAHIPFDQGLVEVTHAKNTLDVRVNGSLVLSSTGDIVQFGKMSTFATPLVVGIPYVEISNDGSVSFFPNIFLENYVLPSIIVMLVVRHRR